MSLSSLVHKIPFSIVKAVYEDSLQNGAWKGKGETFWYIKSLNRKGIQELFWVEGNLLGKNSGNGCVVI